MNSGVLPPSTAELNLLLEWPEERTRGQWAGIFAASVTLHLIFFLLGTTIPRLIGDRRETETQVVRHHIPLYLPRELMTQKAPNQRAVTKHIDLADLMESQPAKRSAAGRTGSARRFEIPKQVNEPNLAKNGPPQILPQAPSVSTNPNGDSQAGVAGGLPVPAAPPPTTTPGPFQNIGEAAPPNPHPKLAPPKADVNAAIDGLTQSANGRQLIISDDVPSRGGPGSLGGLEQGPTQHAAVELESDPSGADFKAYLRSILAIVRGNWRRVVPESARMGMLRGRTVVEFEINRAGEIPKLVIADPSGSAPLDRAAVAGLSMSNPLPPLPADYKGLQVRLAFTFAYNMSAK